MRPVRCASSRTQEGPLAVSLRRLARILGVDRGVLAAAVRRGELAAYRGPGMKQMRVFISDGESWLRRHRVNSTPVRCDQARDPVVQDRLARERDREEGGSASANDVARMRNNTR